MPYCNFLDRTGLRTVSAFSAMVYRNGMLDKNFQQDRCMTNLSEGTMYYIFLFGKLLWKSVIDRAQN